MSHSNCLSTKKNNIEMLQKRVTGLHLNGPFRVNCGITSGCSYLCRIEIWPFLFHAVSIKRLQPNYCSCGFESCRAVVPDLFSGHGRVECQTKFSWAGLYKAELESVFLFYFFLSFQCPLTFEGKVYLRPL